jgi:hypothetical protein
MTTVYLLRHGQTDYSKQYLVNGNPARVIRLNDEGVRSCRQRLDRSPGEAIPRFFAGARYVEPLAVADEVLRNWIPALLADLDREEPPDPDARGGAAILRIGRGSAVATFEAVGHSPDKKEPRHA